jgi:serine/threonine-protein kinase
VKEGELIGVTIDDKYRIDSKLGEGGMGAVYRATRLMIGDAVAIKVLHSDQMNDPHVIERFRREAQAAARLKHPNVVTIHDFGVSRNNLVYLVMELVEGDSLRTLIKEQRILSPSTTGEIIFQVCAALEEAHRCNIIHRDLKPDNIIVTASSTGLRVKVLDFGIAKLRDLSVTADNLTQTGAVLGTPHYMSPEQCMGEELDGRSDIYSLGIVIYEMLSGTVPFNPPSMSALIVQHVNQPPPLLRSVNVHISAAIERTVMRALEKRREARPQTADALARELRDAIGDASTSETSQIRRLPTDPLSPITTSSGIKAVLPPTVVAAIPGAISIPQTRATTSGTAPGRLVPLLVGGVVVLLSALGLVIWLLFARGDTIQRQDDNLRETSAGSDSTGKDLAVTFGALRGEDKVLKGEALSETDLSGLSLTEIRRLRNTIFARHGRIFQTSELQNYFASRHWYKPKSNYRDADLTLIDRDNIRMTQVAENRLGNPEKSQGVESSVTITATASSSRKPFRSIDYGPGKALDDSMITAWVEGTKGPGIGEWIRFDFGRDVKLRRIIIAPGYFKSQQVWLKNNRLAVAVLYFSDGTSRELQFADQMQEQKVEVGDVTTSWVRIEIKRVHLAQSDTEDTAISEVSFEWQ